MVRGILIARHGETDWNLSGKWQGHANIPLNETGVQQAHSLAAKLENVSIDAIYSSDLDRAIGTAKIVANHKGLGDVRVDGRLRERNLGTFEGFTSDEIRTYLGLRDKTLSILDTGLNPTLEPWQSFISRIIESVEEIRDSNKQGNALVVAHGGVMMALSLTLMEEHEQSRKFTNGEIMHLSFEEKWRVSFSPDLETF